MIARAVVGKGWSAVPKDAAAAVARLTGLLGKKGAAPVSASAAARHYGVPRRTWRRWAAGEVRTLPNALLMVVRRAQLSPAREARLRAAGSRGGTGGVRVTGGETKRHGPKSGKPDKHPRQVMRIGRAVAANPGKSVNTNALLIDAFLSGEPGAMWDALQECADAYVPNMELESIRGISLE